MGAIIAGIANLLGYVLNLIYNIVNNYGLAIILFTILLRVLMIPVNFKQTKNLKKSSMIQEKSKEIQKLYANNQEQMNKEIMNLYKENNMSPLSGCLTSIVTLSVALTAEIANKEIRTIVSAINFLSIKTFSSSKKYF